MAWTYRSARHVATPMRLHSRRCKPPRAPKRAANAAFFTAALDTAHASSILPGMPLDAPPPSVLGLIMDVQELARARSMAILVECKQTPEGTFRLTATIDLRGRAKAKPLGRRG
jgi:hypothetical protein